MHNLTRYLHEKKLKISALQKNSVCVCVYKDCLVTYLASSKILPRNLEAKLTKLFDVNDFEKNSIHLFSKLIK